MSIQKELQQVEEDLKRLRNEVAELRRQVGELGPTDAAERSALINMADEQESLANELEARHEGLLKQIGDSGCLDSQSP
ncbi:putative nuclease with TOPRIM domain [Streptosporangium album]|uniref:Putative nuclease with TOPRIM domain n=1 Tax=Streptosporangium album TaxID=47479 RepID=A0A7W7RR06_9ACTN|nr:hypothetical protein [Streptosporangium album]MBB4936591.1 putative nuclease with TOPRIM domain [Streptosporangium album]